MQNVNIKMMIVFKMTSHCTGTEQEKKRIRNWDKKREEMGFKT